jgi:hypothetical protein
VTPIAPHVCSPPLTWSLTGRELDWTCACGRRWRLEHYFVKGELRGAVLELALTRAERSEAIAVGLWLCSKTAVE